MKNIASLASFVALATAVSADRTFTVNNKCSYTVWYVLLCDTHPHSAAEISTGRVSSQTSTPVAPFPLRQLAGRWPRVRRPLSAFPTTGLQAASGPAQSATSRRTPVRRAARPVAAMVAFCVTRPLARAFPLRLLLSSPWYRVATSEPLRSWYS